MRKSKIDVVLIHVILENDKQCTPKYVQHTNIYVGWLLVQATDCRFDI